MSVSGARQARNLSEAIRLAIREAARVRGLWTAGDEAAEEE